MLFFVVSAFSLYYTMPIREKESYPKLSFYLHRFFRIAPLFYLWVALSIIRDAWYFSAYHPIRMIIEAVALIFNLLPGGQQSFVWASWTIGIEVLYYVAFPLIYKNVNNIWRAMTLLFGFIMLWMFFLTVLQYIPIGENTRASIEQWIFIRFLPVFAIGGISYFVFIKTSTLENYEISKSIGLFLIVLSMASYMFLLNGHFNFIFSDPRVWQGLIYGALLIGLSLNPIKLLVNKFTRYLGKISYSLYLGHTTCVLLLTPIYFYIYRLFGNVSESFLASYILTLACAIPVATMTYYLVEKPGIRLGKRVYAWCVAELN